MSANFSNGFLSIHQDHEVPDNSIPNIKIKSELTGGPRDTENNPDQFEILLDLSAVLCQHFPIISKDFAIVITSQ